MFKEFMMRQMLAKQLKQLPKEQQDQIIEAVTKNPEIFQKIAESAQAKMKAGANQMNAIMEAARENEADLKKLFEK
ncbi:MAG TPA: hypothetical protein VF803_00120 [Candidatus Paceibacterota bacterium]